MCAMSLNPVTSGMAMSPALMERRPSSGARLRLSGPVSRRATLSPSCLPGGGAAVIHEQDTEAMATPSASGLHHPLSNHINEAEWGLDP